MSKSAPAFQFYANDWLSSPKIMMMTPAEEGAYIRLLAIAWASDDCGIPDNDDQLAILSRLGEAWKGSSSTLRECFVSKNGKLFNTRLLSERKKQREWRKKCSAGGKASGKSRKDKALKPKGSCDLVTSKDELKGNSSSSSSSSSSSNTNTPIVPKGDDNRAIPKSFKKWSSEDFIESIGLANHDGLLTAAECNDFHSYWTEPSAAGKFRFAMQKTWDTRRRMQTALRMVYSKQRDSAFQKPRLLTPEENLQKMDARS